MKIQRMGLALLLLTLVASCPAWTQTEHKVDFPFSEFQKAFVEASKTRDWEKVIALVRRAFAELESSKAVEYCHGALELAKRRGDTWAQGAAWWMLGDAYLRTADYDKGLNSCQQALEIAQELGDRRGEGWAAHIIGDIYERRAQYAAAIPPLELSLTRARETRDRMQEGDALGDLGDIYRSLGDYEKSIDFQQQALRLAREVGDRHGEEWALANLGRTYLQIGQYEEALRWHELSKVLAHSLRDHAGVARALGDIGDIYARLGRNQDAKRVYEQGRQLSHENADPREEARALASLAQIHARMRQDELALTTFQQAAQISREVMDSEYLVRIHLGMGHIYLRQADERTLLESARSQFRAASKIAREIDAPPLLWATLDGEGRALEALGDLASGTAQRNYWQQARRAYEQSIQAIESMRSRLRGTSLEVFEVSFLEAEEKHEVYERLINLLVKMGEPETALMHLQRARYAALVKRLRLSDAKTLDPALTELLKQYEDLAHQREAIRALRSEELAKPAKDRPTDTLQNLTTVLSRTEVALHQTWTAIEQIDPNLASLTRISPARWTRLREGIPAGALVVQYLPLRAQLLIFVQSRKGAPTFVAVDVGRAELEALIVQAREEISSIEGNIQRGLPVPASGFPLTPRLREALLRLRAYLIAPIGAEVKNAQVLAILPYGMLYYLPFGALAREAEPGQLIYLVEEIPVVYLHELTADGLGVKSSAMFQGSSVFTAFGNPDGSLPSAEREVMGIADLLAEVRYRIYAGKEASLTAVLDLPERTGTVHFATHGVLDQQDLNESYLVLADGRLRQREIYGLGLRKRGTHLVVLSACQTFPGLGQPGVEVLGLADAFIKSGARAVLASLWSVETESTTELMVRFYEVLLRGDSVNKAEALRQAQLALLHDPLYSHPYFWAPFLLYGDWR